MGYKKLILSGVMFFLIVFLIGGVDAFEFDNVKDTNGTGSAGYPNIVIDNFYGLGDVLWSGELTKNTDSCGIECNAEKTITLHKEGSLIDEIKFETILENDMRVEQSIREYQFYVKINKSWEEYELGTKLSTGTYEVKLEGEKKPSRTVDWIIKSQGLWIDEWAVWGNISQGDDAEIILNSPTDGETSDILNPIFNATANVTDGSFIANMSFWHNGTGIWHLNQSLSISTLYENSSGNVLTGGNSVTQKFGIRFKTLRAGTLYQVELAQDIDPATKCYLYEATSCSNLISSPAVVGDKCNFNYKLKDDMDYVIVADQEGATYKKTRDLTPTFNNGANGMVDFITGISNCADDSGGWSHFENLIFRDNETTQTFTIPINEPIIWGIEACDTDGACGVSENRTLFLDTTSPQIEITYPDIIDYQELGKNLTLNWTISDTNLDSCWYDHSGSNISVTCSSNTTQINIIDLNNKNLTFYANDSVGNINSTFHEWDYKISANSQTYSNITLENSVETFEINVTLNSSLYTSTSANLIYDGTSSAATKVGSGDNVVFTADLAIPSVSSNINNSFYWEFALFNGTATEFVNSTTNNQSVLDFNIDDCSVNPILIYNMSLKNEETQALINGTSNNSIIEVDLSLSAFGTENHWLNFSNTYTSVNPAQICANIDPDIIYRIDMTASYTADDLVSEFYYIDNGTLQNSTVPTNIDFFDLELADSTTFLFSFLGEDTLEVPNAIVHVNRFYIGDGVFKEVERAKQDDNGETHVHLVEEDVIYVFSISVDGQTIFTSSQYNAKCLSTPCQIELEASPDFEGFETDWDLMPGGVYTITSDGSTRQITLEYTSELSVTMNLTVAKQDYAGEIEVIDDQQITVTSGTLTITVPQSAGNVTYYAIVYRNNEYIAHRLIDFSDSTDYFGNTGKFMGFLMIMALVLMGAAEGIIFFVFLILALIVVAALTLFELGYYALVGFICAVGVLMYKLIKRGRTFR